MKVEELKKALRKFATPKKAKGSAWFFKTKSGQYGEGDKFIGVTVPELRKIAKEFENLSLTEVEKLLNSPIHEERLISLFILTAQFKKAPESIRKKSYDFYLRNTKRINNWDLVDSSAEQIVGTYLLDKPRDILFKLAKSDNLWERRIAIISTFEFIKNGQSKDTLKIAEILLRDKEDLMNKAVGWMLREVGKRVSKDDLIKFLNKNYSKMSRTTLRYAIEPLPEEKRQAYIKGYV